MTVFQIGRFFCSSTFLADLQNIDFICSTCIVSGQSALMHFNKWKKISAGSRMTDFLLFEPLKSGLLEGNRNTMRRKRQRTMHVWRWIILAPFFVFDIAIFVLKRDVKLQLTKLRHFVTNAFHHLRHCENKTSTIFVPKVYIEVHELNVKFLHERQHVIGRLHHYHRIDFRPWPNWDNPVDVSFW